MTTLMLTMTTQTTDRLFPDESQAEPLAGLHEGVTLLVHKSMGLTMLSKQLVPVDENTYLRGTVVSKGRSSFMIGAPIDDLMCNWRKA